MLPEVISLVLIILLIVVLGIWNASRKLKIEATVKLLASLKKYAIFGYIIIAGFQVFPILINPEIGLFDFALRVIIILPIVITVVYFVCSLFFNICFYFVVRRHFITGSSISDENERGKVLRVIKNWCWLYKALNLSGKYGINEMLEKIYKKC